MPNRIFHRNIRVLGLTTIVILALTGCSKTQTRAEKPPAQSTLGSAEVVPGAPAGDDLVFELATDRLPQDQTQLVNGIEVKLQTRDWPTVLITPLAVPPGPDGKPRFGKCTGTLVGPGVVLLAAHCLDQKKSELRPAFLKADGVTIQMTCAINPDYLKPPAATDPSPRRSEDFGLCYADTKVKLPSLAAMRFEQVDVSPLNAKSQVLMMGYGCTDLDTQKQDQILRIGEARITEAAGAPGIQGAYAQILSHGPPEPALCPGDSGGPLMSGATVAQQTLPRRVRGVNSSIQPVSAGLLSRIAMLSHPSFASWANSWIGQFPDAYICGLPAGPSVRSCRI